MAATALGGRSRDTTSDDSPFFRSAPMSLIQLYVPTEAVQSVVAELGELGVIQFQDLNPDVTAFQRTFTGEIRKLDEMERKINVLLEHASKEDVEVRCWITAGPSPAGTGESAVALRGKALQELEELHPQLSEIEERVLQLDTSQKDLIALYLHTAEWHGMLHALALFLAVSADPLDSVAVVDSFAYGDDSDASEIRIDDRETESMELGGPAAAQGVADASFVAGTILKRKLAAFERVLWRALRGNVFIRSADLAIDTRGIIPSSEASEPKSAFVAYVHGVETLARLRKICEALGCALYEADLDVEKRKSTIVELAAKLDDLHAVSFNTRQAKRAALNKVSESLERWLLLVRKKKALFATINCFSCDSDISTRKYYLAEGWCLTSSLPDIDARIKTASERAGMHVAPVINILEPGSRKPPTHFPTNCFTKSFQEMTDSYGIGTYREVNPSLFMIITLPFLFAVMFGDIGHALMITCFAAWLVLDERRLQSKRRGETEDMVFGGRYIILLMGLFSIFTGLIYNDVFSRAMNILPSSWQFAEDGAVARPNPSYVYPFGVDHAWSRSSNAMLFMNSYKMKQAILMGIVQMVFGILLSAANDVYFNNWIDLYCTFIPQMLFMLSIFGYLGFLIVYKWIASWHASILTTFIGMLLKFGAVEGEPIFTGQLVVQQLLLVVAFICIPWMFLAKPLYLTLEKQRLKTQGYQHASENSDSTGTDSISSTTRKAAHDEQEHAMSELWVHQLIHTIEFVLGSVSNTASYLRLWALSLAHAELSDVMWNMILAPSFGNPALLFVAFHFWFVFTIGILVMMEGMSAFLHALRLHWVEFNNKFYSASGVKFEPFSLRDDLMLE